MPKIKPITELRDTNKLSEAAHAFDEPIFITKNGYNDLVVMSDEYYSRLFNNVSKDLVKRYENNPLDEVQSNCFGFIKVACAAFN